MFEGGAGNFDQIPKEALDAEVFAETEEYRLRLRLIRNTIRNRSELLTVEAGILEKLQAESFWPQKIAALKNRMTIQKGELNELKEKEKELEKRLAQYPEAYRDSAADLLDKMDSGQSN